MLLSLLPWYWRWGAVLALAASLYVLGRIHGQQAEQVQGHDAERAALVRVIRIERKQAAISQIVAEQHEAGRIRDRVIYRNIEKEVIRYVASPQHAVCHLDYEWLRLHNAAALSIVPEPADSADAAAGEFTSDDALQTVTTNYQACQDNARQLADLQRWLLGQSSASADLK
ncbi:hypothetical protein FNU76_00315 [Chitinimonas arctica]|uniref:Uncharacterized protein n=1 Tax=Chitinimonas arctica TaxID=2594795 RepID=A0A516S9S2_9NEIS|nr:hypothetical protein [Chitinimonas arctica]QDQ24910.1 hypothetical protein FNU76_00315 [Chitinimonas arctica]